MNLDKLYKIATIVMAVGITIITIDTVLERVSIMSLPEAAMSTTSTNADASVSCKVGYSYMKCQPVVIAQAN